MKFHVFRKLSYIFKLLTATCQVPAIKFYEKRGFEKEEIPMIGKLRIRHFLYTKNKRKTDSKLVENEKLGVGNWSLL